MSIQENLLQVEKKIASAERSSGQDGAVTLIAVSKTVGIEQMEEAYRCGVRNFGENHAQEIQKKYPHFSDRNVSFHMIGTLQTNKVRHVIDKVEYIHSLDRMSLAKEIDKRACAIKKIQKCFIQVNISKENSKHGLQTESDLISFTKDVAKSFKNVAICGLMGMAPHEDDPEETRKYFKVLKNLAEKIESLQIENVSMQALSMGMSNDYSIAIEEGATFIRVGTSIFGERDYSI